MFASKCVRISLIAYYEARKIFHERFRHEVGWARLTDWIFKLGLEKLKTLPEDEVLKFLKGGGG